jgi:hypothetical protein
MPVAVIGTGGHGAGKIRALKTCPQVDAIRPARYSWEKAHAVIRAGVTCGRGLLLKKLYPCKNRFRQIFDLGEVQFKVNQKDMGQRT